MRKIEKGGSARSKDLEGMEHLRTRKHARFYDLCATHHAGQARNNEWQGSAYLSGQREMNGLSWLRGTFCERGGLGFRLSGEVADDATRIQVFPDFFGDFFGAEVCLNGKATFL